MPREKGSKNGIKKESICFWCKQPFSYRVPQELAEKMQYINFIQVFCDEKCEIEYNHYIQNIQRQADELKQQEQKKIQICPDCGLIPKHKSPQNKWCPKCHGRYELREMIENDRL